MELFKSLETRVKIFTNPFKHFEINQPLTNNAIEEIAKAEVVDPKKFEILNEDGEKIEVKGDHVIKNEYGRLTTLYHHMNNLSSAPSNMPQPISTKEVKNV